MEDNKFIVDMNPIFMSNRLKPRNISKGNDCVYGLGDCVYGSGAACTDWMAACTDRVGACTDRVGACTDRVDELFDWLTTK